jgi:hypothetical protein
VSVVVFLGPTLSSQEARRHLAATYLPPAAQGDVFRVAREHPTAIGIVDGYFDRVPAVWHKEILWAMAEGIHVFGAASMGALRAAELESFGMVGVGAIYEAFRSGALEDDDEVAVAHGDSSSGYRVASEAMVNIRATLRAATSAGVLGEAARVRLENAAKSLFYPDRSFARLFAMAQREGVSPHDVEDLKVFVASHRVDEKRSDALLLLDAIGRRVSDAPRPSPVAYTLEHTDAWDQLVASAGAQPAASDQTATTSADLLAAEVRLLGRQGQSVLATALARVAAGLLACRAPADDRDGRAAVTDRRLRLEHRARDPRGFDGWRETQGLTESEYQGLVRREADMEWLRALARHEVDRHVLDELRLTADFSGLAARARQKDALLANYGMSEPSLADAGMDLGTLVEWYFQERLKRPLPIHMESYLSQVGLPGLDAWQREALRELLYMRLSKTAT